MSAPNPSPHLSEEDLVLAHYGDLPDDEQQRAERHLAECPGCREARARLVETLELVDAAPGEDPPADFERVMWARVQAALPPAEAQGWRAWWQPRWAMATAAGLAVVVAAFLVGRWSGGAVFTPATGPAPATGPEQAAVVPAAAEVTERVLLVAAGDHLDRTQMVLAELVNADPSQPGILDVDRERAADLVSTNRVIRQSASAAGDEAMAALLDDLERVLLEVANGGGDDARAELEMVRARIESRGILFRLRVVSSDVRQREAQPRRRPTASPVS